MRTTQKNNEQERIDGKQTAARTSSAPSSSSSAQNSHEQDHHQPVYQWVPPSEKPREPFSITFTDIKKLVKEVARTYLHCYLVIIAIILLIVGYFLYNDLEMDVPDPRVPEFEATRLADESWESGSLIFDGAYVKFGETTLQELLDESGWTISGVDAQEMVAPHSTSNYISPTSTKYRGHGIFYYVMLYNTSDTAKPVTDCVITLLEFAMPDDYRSQEIPEIVLPKDVHLGYTKFSEALAAYGKPDFSTLDKGYAEATYMTPALHFKIKNIAGRYKPVERIYISLEPMSLDKEHYQKTLGLALDYL